MRQGIAAHTSSHAKFRPKPGTRSAPRRVLQMARNSAASMPAAKTEHIPNMMSRIRYARQAHRGASIGQKLAARLNESHFRSLQGSRTMQGRAPPRRTSQAQRRASRSTERASPTPRFRNAGARPALAARTAVPETRRFHRGSRFTSRSVFALGSLSPILGRSIHF